MRFLPKFSLAVVSLTLLLVSMQITHGQSISYRVDDNRLVVVAGDQELLHYVFSDPVISRPYFAHVKSLSGKQVSRNFPPVAGVDKADHATMHPGIWMSFGDINGNDYWRLKAKTEHVRFSVPPKVIDNQLAFEVENRYLDSEAKQTVCTEKSAISVELLEQGYMLRLASTFSSAENDLRFGDQEEMGLGIRLSTPIAVEKKMGGRILDSEGRRNGEQVWGKTAKWCDYSGPLDGTWAGMTILTSPKNFRSCWSHARDYGFVAMNPFGLNAFTKADKKDIVVKKGESLTLGYAVVVHESASESEYKPQAAYETYLSRN